MDDGTFKLINNYNDPIRNDEYCEIGDNSIQIILPIGIILDDKFQIMLKAFYSTIVFVLVVFLKKIHKKGYSWTIIYLEKGIPLKVKVKLYHYRHCFKWTQTEFVGYFDKHGITI